MQLQIRRKYSSRVPRGLSKMSLTPELSEMVQNEALTIFTSMVNSGQSFQSALLAVFLSGMSAAKESSS